MKGKLLLGVFILLTVFCSTAQDYSDSWTAFFSYNNINAISYGPDKIYAAAENTVFTYNILTDDIETLTTIDGLSAETISAIYYSERTATLFVGYVSGLIDVVRQGQDVFTIVDILNKVSIPPNEKRINHFSEFDGQIYIASEFGISLYNALDLEFDDSYFIGDNGSRLNVLQTTVLDGYIYAATQTQGIRRAQTSSDALIDFQNWSVFSSGSWRGIAALGDQLYAINDTGLFSGSAGTALNLVASFPNVPQTLATNENQLTLTTANGVYLYASDGSIKATIGTLEEFEDTYNTAVSYQGEIYIGTAESGMLIVSASDPQTALQVLPEGPLRNDPFNIEATPGELWVVYGDYNNSFNPFPLKKRGVSHFDQELGWLNIPFDELLEANNLVNIAIDPNNTANVFFTGYNSGLLELSEGVPVVLYDETNSTLQDLNSNPTDVRLNGAAFDRDGNLWFNSSRVNEALIKKTGDSFTGFPIEDFLPNYRSIDSYTELVIDNQNNIFFGSNKEGVIAFNPQTETFASIKGQEETGNLPTDDVRALAIDNRGTLWIGTTGGLRLLFGPSRVFSEEEVRTTSIVVLEGDIPVEVLNDQVVTCITVDGNNNKWVGTLASGAFYFSPNGQETLLHFDDSNSPLPTNNISDISIDEASGVVYFATPEGLVAYSGKAVAPQEDLGLLRAYPNPVRPEYQGMVTIDGLTTRANVKITDVAGNLVYEEVSEGGSIQWDTTAFGRHRVASGVYFVLVTSSDATTTKIAKLMIIR